MKVLMLGWELPPHNSGGLGVACYQLCKSLSQKSVDIEFILPYTAQHNCDFMDIKSALPQDASNFLRAGSAYDSFKYALKETGEIEWIDIHGQMALYEEAVAKLANVEEFDIIHAHDWLTCRAALRAKENSGKPLVLHIHSIEADRAGGHGRGNPYVREIEQLAMLMADRVIAVSAHTKKAIVREYAIPKDKIEIVHNSIDRDWYESLDENNAYKYLEKMKSRDYKVVVNIGRITIQKGLYNFLISAKEVIKRAPKTLFLIVGSGEQEQELLELCAQLGISRNVIFTGFQRGKNLRDAFAIGDLFVMPSVSEPFGLTPLEAVGYGTPALISKQSGVAEVLRNCLKVDYWDTDEMANQITAVVQNSGLGEELHRNSLKEYETLSWENAANKLIKFYNQHTLGGYIA